MPTSVKTPFVLQRSLIKILGDVTNNDWQAVEEGEDELEELEKKLRGLDLPPKVRRARSKQVPYLPTGSELVQVLFY